LIRRPIKKLFFICIGLAILTSGTETAFACPTCKAALSADSSNLQQGFAISILFMMTMPFLIIAGWSVFIVRSLNARKNSAVKDVLATE
jgi:hypothetical protein